MNIAHAAIYTANLELLRDFYVTYFNGNAGPVYENKSNGFRSYFIEFDSDAALELMTRASGLNLTKAAELNIGYSHLAFAVGDSPAVNELTERLRRDGFTVVTEPRLTGDGYYESCVLDPDGNHVEITC
jgi:Lactoylglutathione lyase and related lyases